MAAEPIVLAPQPGPQQEFNSTPADIAIIGGSGGGGKTHACNLEVCGNVENPGFTFLYIRKHLADITQTGGLLDATQKIFPLLGGKYNQNNHEWTFPSGCVGGFGHMEDMYRYKSAEICLLLFEELNELEEDEFWYMFSRNRSTCGIRPYIRGTANPAPGWLADLLFAGGYVDPQTGYAIDEMSGVIRWIVRNNEGIVEWFDSNEDAAAAHPDLPALSFTFIRAKLEDNPALLKIDPLYKAKLNALPPIERARMRDGNWKVKPAAGLLFKRYWLPIVPRMPHEINGMIRYWDLAGTEERKKKKGKASNDPDWTVGVLMARTARDTFCVLDRVRIRGTPLEVEETIQRIARSDAENWGCDNIGIELDPGQAAIHQTNYYTRILAGYTPRIFSTNRKSKLKRAEPFSAQCQAGNVSLLAGEWNESLITELEAFPDGSHDDQVDACSGAFNSFFENPVQDPEFWNSLSTMLHTL